MKIWKSAVVRLVSDEKRAVRVAATAILCVCKSWRGARTGTATRRIRNSTKRIGCRWFCFAQHDEDSTRTRFVCSIRTSGHDQIAPSRTGLQSIGVALQRGPMSLAVGWVQSHSTTWSAHGLALYVASVHQVMIRSRPAVRGHKASVRRCSAGRCRRAPGACMMGAVSQYKAVGTGCRLHCRIRSSCHGQTTASTMGPQTIGAALQRRPMSPAAKRVHAWGTPMGRWVR
jgi:hypothetical protein